jgi:hypothetical protein
MYRTNFEILISPDQLQNTKCLRRLRKCQNRKLLVQRSIYQNRRTPRSAAQPSKYIISTPAKSLSKLCTLEKLNNYQTAKLYASWAFNKSSAREIPCVLQYVQYVVQCHLERSRKGSSHQFLIATGLTAASSCLILLCLSACFDIFSELLFTSCSFKLHIMTTLTAWIACI